MVASPLGLAEPLSTAESARTVVGGEVVTLGTSPGVVKESTAPKLVPTELEAMAQT